MLTTSFTSTLYVSRSLSLYLLHNLNSVSNLGTRKQHHHKKTTYTIYSERTIHAPSGRCHLQHITNAVQQHHQRDTLGSFSCISSFFLSAWKPNLLEPTNLHSLRVPPAWNEQLDLAALTIRSRPFSNKEELMPICYRCSFNNPLISSLVSIFLPLTWFELIWFWFGFGLFWLLWIIGFVWLVIKK